MSKGNADLIDILIKAPGNPPVEREGIAQFILITIPQDNPSTDSAFDAANISPDGIVAAGAWMIKAGAAMKAGTEIPPFGQAFEMSNNLANRTDKKQGNLIQAPKIIS